MTPVRRSPAVYKHRRKDPIPDARVTVSQNLRFSWLEIRLRYMLLIA